MCGSGFAIPKAAIQSFGLRPTFWVQPQKSKIKQPGNSRLSAHIKADIANSELNG